MRRFLCSMIASALFFLDGWGAPLALALLIIVNWDFFSHIAGEHAEAYMVRTTRERLRRNRHAHVKAYWALMAAKKSVF